MQKQIKPERLFSASTVTHPDSAFTEQLLLSKLEIKNTTGQLPFRVTGYFSPSIDGILTELLLMSTPGEAKHDKISKSELAERLSSIDTLEKWYIDMDNAQTAYALQSRITYGDPFGLYLRNFILGSRTEPGGIDPFGIPQSMLMTSPDDTDMQTVLSENFPEVPFIAISNPAFSVGALPQVVLSNDDWLPTVESLAAMASVIVIFFLTSTPGVLHEFEVLRRLGVQERTIIVIASEDPRNNTLLNVGRAVYRQPEDKRPVVGNTSHSIPDDFPHRVKLNQQEKSWQKVVNSVQNRIKNYHAVPSKNIITIPKRPMPGIEINDKLTALALKEFDLGNQLFQQNKGEEAEDAFIRALVYNYFAWSPLGRAVTFISLANVERFILKYPNEAVSCYFNALNLFESLLFVSPTAREYYEQLARGMDLYLRELGDLKRADSVMERFNRFAATGIFDLHTNTDNISTSA